MPSSGSLNPESEAFAQIRPTFWIGQHDSSRTEALTDGQYTQVLNAGVGPLSCHDPRHGTSSTKTLLSSDSPPRQSPMNTSTSASRSSTAPM